MSFKARRVVTGHDGNGKSIVKIDEIVASTPVPGSGASTFQIWSTNTSPADNADEFDGGKREVPNIVSPGGTAFNVFEIGPGDAFSMHRTLSVDYGIVLDGEIELELDAGEIVRLKQGDVFVQRGTIHGWANRSARPCKMAIVVVEAKPVPVAGKVLARVDLF